MDPKKSSEVEWPVSFRVIGIGDKTKSIINEVNSWDYPGVKTIIFGEEVISPSDEDEMVIFLNPDNYDISLMTQSFFQADILTLVIATPGFDGITNSCDAVCLTEQSDIIKTVFGILYPLFHHGYISFDYFDILQLLKNQGRYKVLIGNSLINDKKLNSLMYNFKKVTKQHGSIEHIAMIFSLNRKSEQLFTSEDLRIIQDTTSTLPETIDIKWGIMDDENIKDNQIQMITIFSGKNLKF